MNATAADILGYAAGVAFTGAVGGYVIAAISEHIAPSEQIDPLRWSQHGGLWAGFATEIFFLLRWLGLD